MSAAVMSTSTIYGFGDTILKNHNANNSVRHNNSINNAVRGVRWDEGGRAVGCPPSAPLSRRASNPATPLNMAPLVIQLETPQPTQQQAPQPTPQPTPQPVHRKLDRCHSEPAPSSCKSAAVAAAAAAANINTSRYKTELCRPFEESGSCKYGDKCQFAHGAHELRTLVRHPKYKTELCRTYHTIGLCPYGPRCHFVHNDEESLAKPQMSRPKALTLASAPANGPAYLGGSTADSPSPTSSLSQSPTNSHRSFFMSTEDVFGSVSPTPSTPSAANTAFAFGHIVPPSPVGPASTRNSPSPPGSPFRLPIFNHLSNNNHMTNHLTNQVMKIHLMDV